MPKLHWCWFRWRTCPIIGNTANKIEKSIFSNIVLRKRYEDFHDLVISVKNQNKTLAGLYNIISRMKWTKVYVKLKYSICMKKVECEISVLYELDTWSSRNICFFKCQCFLRGLQMPMLFKRSQFLEKIRGTRKSWTIYRIFPLDLVLVEQLGSAKFVKSRMLISSFMRLMVIPMCNAILISNFKRDIIF